MDIGARQFTAADVASANTRRTIVSEGMELRIWHVSYGKVSIESVLAGEADAIAFTATQDGRGYIAEWAREGESCGDAIRCERWTQAGREFHGWIDAESRKIVQAG